MGIHVDEKEIKDAISKYKKKEKSLSDNLDNAMYDMNEIISSNAMEGKVGNAIVGNINNNLNPVLLGLKITYEQLIKDMNSILKAFQAQLDENSGNGILDENVLESIGKEYATYKSTNRSFEKSFNSIYEDVSDIVGVEKVKSLNDGFEKVRKKITNLNTKLKNFANSQNKKDTSIVDGMKKDIQNLQKFSNIKFDSSNANFSKFLNDSIFSDIVQKKDKEIKAKKKNKEIDDYLSNVSNGILKGLFWDEVEENLPNVKGESAKAIIRFAGENGKYLLKMLPAIDIAYVTATDYQKYKSMPHAIVHGAWETMSIAVGDGLGTAAEITFGPAAGVGTSLLVSNGLSELYYHIPSIVKSYNSYYKKYMWGKIPAKAYGQ
ncbi:MAG: LXG domain-containing protein [Lachnospiraceae bacterium]|nr:LXG domain-containing protein [Lachnospiraceae bacterium]